MNIKEELYKYNQYRYEISLLEHKKAMLYITETPSCTQYLTGMPTVHNNGSTTENAALSIIEKGDKLDNMIDERKKRIDVIDKALNMLTDKQRYIVRERAVNGKGWRSILDNMDNAYTNQYMSGESIKQSYYKYIDILENKLKGLEVY